MPAVCAAPLRERARMLHERDALPLDRAGDESLRAVLEGAHVAKGATQRCRIVPVAALDVPAEGPEPLLELAERDDLLRRLVGLELVAVDDDGEPGEALLCRRLKPLVVLALLKLAVAEHHDDATTAAEMPLRPRDPAALRDSHAERARVRLDPRNVHVWMPVEAAEPPQSEEPLAWDHSEREEHRVQAGHVVPLRREVDVAVGVAPPELGGVELLEEQECHDVHRAEARPEMTRASSLDRDERIEAAHVGEGAKTLVRVDVGTADTLKGALRDESQIDRHAGNVADTSNARLGGRDRAGGFCSVVAMHAVRRAPSRLWSALTELAERRLGAVLLFVAALAVHAARSIAWPLATGRDLDDYLHYYVELFHNDPVLPSIMLGKVPLAPIVDGLLLDVAGGALAGAGLAVMYALSILAWAAVARLVSPGAAVGTSLILLAYPGYGLIFHEVSSEPVFALIFAGWALLVGRAVTAPSPTRFALVGGGIALATLARPGNLILVAFAFLPLLLRAPMRPKLMMTGATLVAAVLPLAAWALLNGARFGEVTLARGGSVVFYHAFVVDRAIEPGNGPQTRRFLDTIERELLTREPYRSYGVGLDEVLSSGSLRVNEDIDVFASERWGWDGGPALLDRVGMEAVRAYPGVYVKNTFRSIWLELSEPLYRVVGAPEEISAHPPTVESAVDGRPLPAPSEGQPIPPGQSFWIVRPDNGIRQVWTSPTETKLVFANADLERRYRQVERRTNELFAAFGDRTGSTTLGLRLNQLSRWFPRPVLWLAVGLVVVVIRRPRRPITLALLTPVAAGLLILAGTAAAVGPDVRYALPVAPAFVAFAVGALLGERRRSDVGGGSHSGATR